MSRRPPLPAAALIISAALIGVLSAPASQAAAVQEPREAGTAADVKSAIDKLGTLEFPVRTAAARTIRRAPAAVAVPALLRATAEHPDEYVRFRALVLLSGFRDPRTREAMLSVIADRNDRLRAVAYAYFEHHPDPQVIPRLIQALDKEESEFVRPALTRAIVAHGADPKARTTADALAMRGQDFFRSVVIEALGDYEAAYALPTLTGIAKLEGPLQDDAVLAMGKIGDKRALETFVSLQRSAPRNVQPTIAAAICLVGVNCPSHQGFLVSSLDFAADNVGFQDLLRASASGLAALAVAGSEEAAAALVDKGGPSRDPARAAIALALGTIALRNTPLMLKVAGDPGRSDAAARLLREAFDMFEEDFEEERFFVTVRSAYWQAPENSPARATAELLIKTLEF